MHNGLVVVTFQLVDHPAGAGGSHLQHLLFCGFSAFLQHFLSNIFLGVSVQHFRFFSGCVPSLKK